MGIFRLRNYSTFIERPEVFPDAHLARAETLCLVVGCRVVITFDDKLDQELGFFFNVVWGRAPQPDFPQPSLNDTSGGSTSTLGRVRWQSKKTLSA
jgi:hypothetical protein